MPFKFVILNCYNENFYTITSPCNKAMHYIKERIQSFKHAFRGIQTLFRETPNARVQLVAAVIAIILGWVFHISSGEWLAIAIVIGLVLAMEAINTALEILADYASKQEIQPAIRNTKDIAAAGVLIAAFIAVAVGAIIFLPKIF